LANSSRLALRPEILKAILDIFEIYPNIQTVYGLSKGYPLTPNDLIRVLHILPGIGKEAHGVGQVALNLARTQNLVGCETQIWCLDDADQIQWAAESSGFPRHKITTFPVVGPHRLGYSLAMMSAATQASENKFDIVHQHGIWTATSQVSNMLRQKHNMPLVIAPHGSLQRWALQKSRLKKQLALMAYERQNLSQSACLHATANSEVDDIRDFGLSNPVAVIPNGVSEDWLKSVGDSDRFRSTYKIPTGRRILFFLSRITPKKGLPMLLQAIEIAREAFSDWLLIIAGVDEFGHKKEVESLVHQLGLEDSVRFLGPMYGQDKRDAFASADVFILPSYSEGSPMVVLDSLATGVPVITTKGTPWESLNTLHCGWWVDVSADGLAKALHDIASLSRDQLMEMGSRGRDLVAAEYSWIEMARKSVQLYMWLLGRESKPDFVIVDQSANSDTRRK
jgi:glycosyltransferase involved in cell wall biosynthesis